MQLVAGVLGIVLAAVAAAAFLAGQHAPQTAPAGAISIEAYQTMVKGDDGMVIVSRNDNCMTLESACDVSGKPAIALMQRWLDDLNASTPPARFAVIDAQMRRHLTVGIAALNAILAAFQAKDQSGLDRAHNLASDQQGWLDEATRGIAASQPGTAATYIASAQAASQAFGGCPSCASLANQVECAVMQSTNCEYEVLYATRAIAPFESALVRVSAPSSLAAQDARLQSDLAQIDTDVLAMAAAQMTGDQAAFDAGRLLLQQALLALKKDAGVVGGA
jgi:hypothetical protein